MNPQRRLLLAAGIGGTAATLLADAFAQANLPPPADALALQDLEQRLRATLRTPDAQLHAILVSEHSENTFAALPARQGEDVVVWVAGFADQAAYEAHRAALDRAGNLKSLHARVGDRLLLSPTHDPDCAESTITRQSCRPGGPGI